MPNPNIALQNPPPTKEAQSKGGKNSSNKGIPQKGPGKWDEKTRNKVLSRIAAGDTIFKACDKAGIAAQTFYVHKAKDPELAKAYEEAQETRLRLHQERIGAFKENSMEVALRISQREVDKPDSELDISNAEKLVAMIPKLEGKAEAEQTLALQINIPIESVKAKTEEALGIEVEEVELEGN